MKEILVIYKKSAYSRYKRYKSAKKFLKTAHPLAVNIKTSHTIEQATLHKVIETLRNANIPFDIRPREKIKTPIKDRKLVITVGGDGTFLEISHHIKDSTPILGINQNPKESVGFYCAATADNFLKYCKKPSPITKASRFQILLNNKPLKELVLNDILVAHKNPAATTRYCFSKNINCVYKTSGLLIAAPGGSSGWMFQEGGKLLPLNSKKIQFISRGMRKEKPKLTTSLEVHSATPESFIFLDGSYITYPFPIGSVLRIQQGSELSIVGKLPRKI